MASFPQLNIFEQIINLPEFKVKNYRFIEEFGLVLIVEKKEKTACCPFCGKKSDKLHKNYRYLVRDLPIIEHDVYLKVNRRQFKCYHCQKTFTEHFDSIKKTRTYTERLAKKIIVEVVESDIKNVAERNSLSEKEVETILKKNFSDVETEKPKGLKRLGIDERGEKNSGGLQQLDGCTYPLMDRFQDPLNFNSFYEIAWVKGQKNYCAVLVDLETKKPIDILEKRTKECLRECFEKWGVEVLENIEEVSIDLWSGYKNLVEELMPNAEVVADRFHVMKLVNEELDAERKLVKRKGEKIKKKAEKEKLLKVIKNSKYCLLKNEEDLNSEQKKKLKDVKKYFPKLGNMHRLKEELRNIFENRDSELIGLLNLSDWLGDAAKDFPNSSATIIRWLGEIIGYFKNRTTQGIVEGINNKLKLIKRKAYGFKNFDNFRLRSLLSF